MPYKYIPCRSCGTRFSGASRRISCSEACEMELRRRGSGRRGSGRSRSDPDPRQFDRSLARIQDQIRTLVIEDHGSVSDGELGLLMEHYAWRVWQDAKGEL